MGAAHRYTHIVTGVMIQVHIQVCSNASKIFPPTLFCLAGAHLWSICCNPCGVPAITQVTWHNPETSMCVNTDGSASMQNSLSKDIQFYSSLVYMEVNIYYVYLLTLSMSSVIFVVGILQVED